MSSNFSGKKILVTGAGRGIGRAITIALAKAGAKVYALSRTKSTLDTLVEEYPDIVPIVQDLKDWDETRRKLEQLEPLDGLVNNAVRAVRYSSRGSAVDCDKEELEQILQVNLLAYINCIQVIAKQMIKADKGGSIVNVSSIASTFAMPNMFAYCISKAGVDMVTKQFALELGQHSIRVNSINPTLVLTDHVMQVIESGVAIDKNVLERMAIKRLPTVEEIAGPVLYLLGDASTMVTGTLHFVDGGLTSNITTKQ